jgi:RNA polymerase sigma factor (sigma-70 family)
MHSDVSNQSDSSLLQCWCEEHSQNAFAELVRRYERLVAGAALRQSGDFELARDVCQHVFSMLASKAHLLVGRDTIAGWLYRAASHVAAELQRADLRRQARHTATAERAAGDATGDHWPLLEEALSKLSLSDREALLLHYFQDLSYPDMALQLGIGEAAARKRVSRAVQNLGQILRKHGIHSPMSLLTGAVAVQATFPSQTTLAASALVGTSATPFPLTVHALMSHLPVKVAVCAATLALVPLGYQWKENSTLHSELAAVPQVLSSPTITTPESADAAAVTKARAELVRVEARIQSAEKRAAELASFKARADEELVVSMGSIDEMAKTVGGILRQLSQLREMATAAQPSDDPKEREALMQKTQENMAQFLGLVREFPRLERDPAKAARFYAAVLGETAGLDEGTRRKLEPPLQTWVTQLQHDSLALPQRPTEPMEAIATWDKRRVAAMQEISKQLQALVPADKADRASLLRALMIDSEGPGATEAFDIISGRKQ